MLDVKTIGEDILGAEIIAGKELTEAAGSIFDAMEKGSSIWEQQARWLAEDYFNFWMSSLSQGLTGNPAALMKLIDSRSEHIATGMHQTGDLIEKECTPLTKMWTDFIGVVAQDWRQA